jgi:hypothetical protein
MERNMTPFQWQVIGLLGLLAALILGEWALQSRRPAAGAERQTRAVILAAALGGLIGAPAWWQDLPYAFSWDLPPMAARFLAVAAISFAVGFAMILRQGSIGALRLGCGMLAVYLVPLTGAILLRHLDRFDLGAPVTWVFFALVAVLSLGALNGLFRLPLNERGLSGGIDTGIALVAGLWGLALFFWPDGPQPLIWPWPRDPLTTRLIAAMFLTIATAGWLSEGRAERRIALWVAMIYGLGIAATIYASRITGAGGPPAYLVVWGAIGLVAFFGLVTDRATVRAGAASRPD